MEKFSKIYIDGKWITSASEKFIGVINPATEEIVAEVVEVTKDEVDYAVSAAKEALKTWKNLPLQDRKIYIERILEGLKKNKEELAQLVTKELGAPISFSRPGQVELSIKEMQATLEEVDNFKFESTMFGSKIKREPFGVIACITPWNWPLNQIQRKLTPALLAGNTLVVKPASNTPLTALKFAQIIDEAMLPKGVFNIITGSGGTTGEYLANHKDIPLISFTGSTEVGRNLYTAASKGIKKLVLELGGKSPLIYLNGGDKKLAVKRVMDAIILNSGQSCSALTRLFIPEEDKTEFKKLIQEYAEKVVLGDPMNEETTIGPLVSKEQMEKVLALIESGKREGADLILGGNRIGDKGYFIEPTVFFNVKNDMEIAKKEIFGPVLSVLTYKSVQDAVEMANDTTYGLSGAVVGPENEAIKVAERIEAGNVFVNDGLKSAKVPFGGYKESGLGREVGLYGLEDYLEVKAIIMP